MISMKTKNLLVLCASVALFACGQKQETKEKAPTRVKTEVLTTAHAESGQAYVGIVEEAEATAVSFTSMGTVRRVYVNEGQSVGRGQLIADMDDTQARNLLMSAQANVNQAEDALQRYALLHERGSLTEAQWVEIQSKVTQARSQLAVAKKSVADCRLTAPVSGIIGRKNVNAGETAMPSQAVVTILDINSVKVKFSVPEAEMQRITPNTPTLITVEATGRTFGGGRIEKGVQADALTHTYDVRVRVDNRGRTLLPGMVAKVELSPSTTSASSDIATLAVATLPLTAIQRRVDGSLFAWTVDNANTAHRTRVEIGASVGNRVEVVSGLTEGQRIVVEGYQKLSEGSKVIY